MIGHLRLYFVVFGRSASYLAVLREYQIIEELSVAIRIDLELRIY